MKVCVFAASSSRIDDAYKKAAEELGNAFARENVHCANVSAGRTKQAFVLLSQKVLANIRTALGE